MKEIIVATKNKGKATEFKQFFAQFNVSCKSLLDIEEAYPDIEETGTTFAENAILKAETAANYFQQPVIADDSGLVIDALNGKPGIETARYAGEQKSDDDNMEKVLKQLTGVEMKDRTARFIALLAIARPGKETITREGICEGNIAFEKKGTKGFGYDPIFIPKGYAKTMAELSSETKNAISHRSQAFKQLEMWFSSIH